MREHESIWEKDRIRTWRTPIDFFVAVRPKLDIKLEVDLVTLRCFGDALVSSKHDHGPVTAEICWVGSDFRTPPNPTRKSTPRAATLPPPDVDALGYTFNCGPSSISIWLYGALRLCAALCCAFCCAFCLLLRSAGAASKRGASTAARSAVTSGAFALALRRDQRYTAA